MIAVAVDVQGPSAARPWYEKHKVTFPSLVDASNALGRVMGYKVIPNQFYVDEFGIFHGRYTESMLKQELAKPAESVLPADLKERLRKAAPNPAVSTLITKADARNDDFAAQLAVGKASLAAGDNMTAIEYLRRATTLRSQSPDVLTALAAAHLAGGDKPAAAVALRKALQMDPKNWLIHKQIWAIEHPEHFYAGPVDFKWQRQQLRREAQEGE